MRCLVTGAGGFIGGFLVEELLEQGYEVLAADLVRGPLLSALDHERFSFAQSDILDPESIRGLIGRQSPDFVFHLAAQSYPGVSWEDPAGTCRVNVVGTVNVLEAVRKAVPGARVLTVCSSAEYAARSTSDPIGEGVQLDPSSPYGISKLAEDHLARVYGDRYGASIVRVRPFYLIGPRKTGDVSSDFARGIVAAERGENDHVSVGNLDVVRDLLDVRDGAAAFRLLAEKGVAGEVYNVCAGKGYKIGDVLEMLKSMAKVTVESRVDMSLLRPIDEMVKIGDPTRLEGLGWQPRFDIRQTLEEILEYWRAQS